MLKCMNCGSLMPETEIFCTECGTRLRSEPPPTERMNIDPTLVIPRARPTGAGAPPPANTTQVILKTAIATILLISVGALLAWLVLRDGRDTDKTSEMRADAGSRNQSNSRNSNESSVSPTATPYANTNVAANRNTATTAPTPYPAPTTTPPPSNSANGKLAYLNKSDVRLRDAADLHATVIRENLTYGTRLVVLGTSPREDNVWVQSEGRYVRSTWTYVQLEDYPSIKGWVVSYVVSYR